MGKKQFRCELKRCKGKELGLCGTLPSCSEFVIGVKRPKGEKEKIEHHKSRKAYKRTNGYKGGEIEKFDDDNLKFN